MQSEPVRQGHGLLHGVVAVDVVPLPVGELLLDDVPPVAGSAEDHVAAPGGDGTLQHRLQGSPRLARQFVDGLTVVGP